MRRMLLPTLTLALLHSGAVQAHLLKVFAYAEGDTLHGNAYFAGGEPASGAAVEIQSTAGEILATLKSDTAGEFRHTLTERTTLRVIADSGDGHRAEWVVGADEQSSVLAAGDAPEAVAGGMLNADSQQLTALVEQAVARQIGPLRRELQASQERATLADIVGGIGLIFGLSGVLLWWRSRQTHGHRPPRDAADESGS